MNIEIDVEQFARDIKAGKSIGGKDGALGSLIKQLTEAALAAEIDSHLTQDLNRNRKNGYATKTMKSEHGEFELDEDFEDDLKDALDLMGLKISHSVEYNFNDQLSLVADFGLNWLFWNFSSSSEDYSEDYYTDYVEKSQNELNANLGISYTKLSLHFKLNN